VLPNSVVWLQSGTAATNSATLANAASGRKQHRAAAYRLTAAADATTRCSVNQRTVFSPNHASCSLYATFSRGVYSFCGQTSAEVKKSRKEWLVTTCSVYASSYVHQRRVTFRYSSHTRTITAAPSAKSIHRL